MGLSASFFGQRFNITERDLERYLGEHVKCVKCRPIALPGWRKFLEAHGYTLVRVDADKRHIIMEKVL